MTNAVKDVVLHGRSRYGDGRSICGDVDEGDPTIDLPPPNYARRGQVVTCPVCLQAITEIHELFTKSGRRK